MHTCSMSLRAASSSNHSFPAHAATDCSGIALTGAYVLVRAAQGCGGTFKVAEVSLKHPQIVPGFSARGVKMDCKLVEEDSPRDVPHLAAGHAQIVQRLGMLGIVGESTLV